MDILSTEIMLRKLRFLETLYNKSVSPTERAKEEMQQVFKQVKKLIEKYNNWQIPNEDWAAKYYKD